eukprot:162613-Amphidinium_carterae.1
MLGSALLSSSYRREVADRMEDRHFASSLISFKQPAMRIGTKAHHQNWRCCELVNTREIDPGTCSVSRTTQAHCADVGARWVTIVCSCCFRQVGVWGSLPHHNVQCANHLSSLSQIAHDAHAAHEQ